MNANVKKVLAEIIRFGIIEYWQLLWIGDFFES